MSAAWRGDGNPRRALRVLLALGLGGLILQLGDADLIDPRHRPGRLLGRPLPGGEPAILLTPEPKPAPRAEPPPVQKVEKPAPPKAAPQLARAEKVAPPKPVAKVVDDAKAEKARLAKLEKAKREKAAALAKAEAAKAENVRLAKAEKVKKEKAEREKAELAQAEKAKARTAWLAKVEQRRNCLLYTSPSPRD